MHKTLQEIQSKLTQLRPKISEKYYVSSLGLFGSVTRSDFSESSDIDIIVEFSKPVGMEFIDLAEELESYLNRKVDLVSRKGIKAKYFKTIETEIIYV